MATLEARAVRENATRAVLGQGGHSSAAVGTSPDAAPDGPPLTWKRFRDVAYVHTLLALLSCLASIIVSQDPRWAESRRACQAQDAGRLDIWIEGFVIRHALGAIACSIVARLWQEGVHVLSQSAGTRAAMAGRDLLTWFSIALFFIGNAAVARVNPYCADQPWYRLGLALLLITYIQLLAPVIALLLLMGGMVCCMPTMLRFLNRMGLIRSTQQPASRTDISRLPETTFSPGMQGLIGDPSCSICLSSYANGERLRRLPCAAGHHFHTACVDTWLVINANCPVCRGAIFAADGSIMTLAAQQAGAVPTQTGTVHAGSDQVDRGVETLPAGTADSVNVDLVLDEALVPPLVQGNGRLGSSGDGGDDVSVNIPLRLPASPSPSPSSSPRPRLGGPAENTQGPHGGGGEDSVHVEVGEPAETTLLPASAAGNSDADAVQPSPSDDIYHDSLLSDMPMHPDGPSAPVAAGTKAGGKAPSAGPVFTEVPFGCISLPVAATSSPVFTLSGLVPGFDQSDSLLAVPEYSLGNLWAALTVSPWATLAWIVYHACTILPFDVFFWTAIAAACTGMPGVKATHLQLLPRILKTIRYQAWLGMTNVYGLRRTLVGPPLNLFDFLLPLHFLACAWCWNTVVPFLGEKGDTEFGPTFWGTVAGLPNFTGDINGVVTDPSLPTYVDATTRYVSSLFFIVWMALCVGMGDSKGPTNSERLLSVFTMAYGAGLLAYAVGTQTNMIAYLTADGRARVDAITDLQQWLLYRNVPSNLSHAALKHARADQEATRARMGDVMEGVPSDLFNETQSVLLSGRIAGTPLTRLLASNTPLVTALASGMKSYKFERNEVVVRQGGEASEVYFILRGRVDLHVCSRSVGALASGAGSLLEVSKRSDTVPDWAAQLWAGRISEGCYLGLGPAVLGGSHPVSARAAMATEVLALPASLLSDALSAHGLEGDEEAVMAEAGREVASLAEVIRSLANAQSSTSNPSTAEVDAAKAGPSKYSWGGASSARATFVPGPVLIKSAVLDLSTDPRVLSVTSAAQGEGAGEEAHSLAIRTLRYTQAPASQSGAGLVNYFGLPSRVVSSSTPSAPITVSSVSQDDLAGTSLSAVKVVATPLKGATMDELLKEVAIPKGQHVWEDKESPLALLQRGILFPDVLPKQCWDAWIILLVIYTAITVPLVLGFNVEYLDGVSHWTNMEAIVDFFFFTDMVLNFRQAFEDNETGCYVTIPDAIANEYFKGFFITDFVSNIPIDAIVIAVTGSAGGTRLFKLVRLVRLVRLLKIANSDAVKEVFLKHPTGATILSLVFQIGFACHLLTSFFVYCISSLDDLRPWWAVTVYTTPDDSGMGWIPSQVAEPSLGEKYLAAFYWSISTVTTTGVGDIGPGTNIQRGYNAFAILFGVTFFAYCTGVLVNALTAQDGAGKAQSQLDLVEDAALAYRVPASIRGRLLRSHRWRLGHHSVFDEDALVSSLPSTISGDLRLFVDDRAAAALYILHTTSWSNTLSLLRTVYLPVNFILAVIGSVERRFVLAGDAVVRAGEKVGAIEFVHAGRVGRLVSGASEHGVRSMEGDPRTPKGVEQANADVETESDLSQASVSKVSPGAGGGGFSMSNASYAHPPPSSGPVPGGYAIGWHVLSEGGEGRHVHTLLAESDTVLFRVPVDALQSLLAGVGLKAVRGGVEKAE